MLTSVCGSGKRCESYGWSADGLSLTWPYTWAWTEVSCRTWSAASASLVAAGVGATPALGAALSMGALGVLTGAFVMVLAVTWTSGAALATRLRTT